MFKKNEEHLYQRTTTLVDTWVVFLPSWTSYLVTQEHWVSFSNLCWISCERATGDCVDTSNVSSFY